MYFNFCEDNCYLILSLLFKYIIEHFYSVNQMSCRTVYTFSSWIGASSINEELKVTHNIQNNWDHRQVFTRNSNNIVDGNLQLALENASSEVTQLVHEMRSALEPLALMSAAQLPMPLQHSWVFSKNHSHSPLTHAIVAIFRCPTPCAASAMAVPTTSGYFAKSTLELSSSTTLSDLILKVQHVPAASK
jgi:hypothetical protein